MSDTAVATAPIDELIKEHPMYGIVPDQVLMDSIVLIRELEANARASEQPIEG